MPWNEIWIVCTRHMHWHWLRWCSAQSRGTKAFKCVFFFLFSYPGLRAYESSSSTAAHANA